MPRDPIANEHKNVGFQPRQIGVGSSTGAAINQPPTAQNTAAVRQALQNSVPLQTMPEMATSKIDQETFEKLTKGVAPPLPPKVYPDTEDMWNLIKPGQVITEDIPMPGAQIAAPAKKGKGGKKNKPAVVESAATGATGPVQEAVIVSPDVPINAVGKPVIQMPGQQAAVMYDPHVIPAPLPAPPKTRQEYNQQQMVLNGGGSYPDVADIFSNKIPGIIPLHNQSQAGLPTLPTQRIIQDVTVHHEMPERATAYQALEQFTLFMDGVSHTFLRGQLIYDVNVIDFMLMTKNNKIAPADEVADYITCPACKHHFPPTAGKSPAMQQGTTDYEAYSRGVGLQPRGK